MHSPREALFYQSLEDGQVKCHLCPHGCSISLGKYGLCNVRKNEKGKLYSLNYEVIMAYNLDPIEKKPLYHFYPGSRIFSIGSAGCNLNCDFCQNWSTVHGQPSGTIITSKEIAKIAELENQNIGIAYTYNEPSIWYEFIYDTSVLVHKKGLKNVIVTNGFIQREPLMQLLPYTDAMNIDLKSFNDAFYHDLCGGRLSPVKETIQTAAKYCHLEITTLVIEGLNDSIKEIKKLSQWISQIRPDIPLHLSRYFPAYKMQRAPTSVDVLYSAQEEAKKYLEYVYVGNVQGADRNTYCPQCGCKIIDRSFVVDLQNIDEEKRCKECGKEISVVM